MIDTAIRLTTLCTAGVSLLKVWSCSQEPRLIELTRKRVTLSVTYLPLLLGKDLGMIFSFLFAIICCDRDGGHIAPRIHQDILAPSLDSISFFLTFSSEPLPPPPLHSYHLIRLPPGERVMPRYVAAASLQVQSTVSISLPKHHCLPAWTIHTECRKPKLVTKLSLTLHVLIIKKVTPTNSRGKTSQHQVQPIHGDRNQGRMRRCSRGVCSRGIGHPSDR